ncbi:MAG: FtsX-like permease family protein [Ardenticatenaceae bacterium]|nr:FtsX-like permease family protein [Ardenticatenaceae bacterium]
MSVDHSLSGSLPKEKTRRTRSPRKIFLAPRWRKVLRDLWQNKARSMLVVLSIAVGVFSVGVISGSQVVLGRELNASYAEINPSHATLMVLNPFGEEVAETIKAMPEIAAAEPRKGVYGRVQTGPDTWQQVNFITLPDFEAIEVDKISSESGTWPPGRHEMVVERTALSLLNAEVGDTVIVKGPNGREREVQIVGLAHDLLAKLFVIDGLGVAYVDEETLSWLGGQDGYLEMRIRVSEQTDDINHIRAVANLVQDKIEKTGSPVFFTMVPTPNQHPLNYVVQALSVMLGILGVLALLLSSFLVINTISSLLAQQTRQIGLMKSFGATTRQISGMYVVMVLIFGLLTLFIALPLGAWGTYGLALVMGDYFNFDIDQFRMPLSVMVLQASVAFLIPIVASLVPIWRGTKTTVHESMNDYGVDQTYGKGRIDQLLLKTRGFLARSRPLVLSIRNTFRRQQRLLLTLGTLIFSGIVFVSVASVNDSLLRTIDTMLSYFQYDVAFQFERPYRTSYVKRVAMTDPDVVAAESWAFYNTRVLHEDGTHGGMTVMFAPPGDTELIKPELEEGRWLRPGEANAVVVNTIFLRDEPDLGLGDEITFKLEGQETEWKIVGVVSGGQVVGMVFVDYDAFSREIGLVDRADWLMVKTVTSDEATQVKVRDYLQTQFDQMGIRVNISATVASEMREVQAIFQILIVMLFFMTFMLAAVGGFGLAGTMSINVLERSREIGIMRAIGASNRSVLYIFLVEGLLIGLLSWVVAVVLAWPVGWYLSKAIGEQFLNTPLDYAFSYSSVLIWLVAVIVLSMLSSLVPAWNASRLTVQRVLAYE